MEKVIRDGKVAVLYSPGFGAGWYSWNEEYPQLLFHPKLVELVENNQQHLITEEFMKEVLGIDIYLGGAEQLKIQWVDQGDRFEIDEYDGSEDVRIFGPDTGLVA